MHIHIHSLIHLVRHARLFGSNMRFLGMLLLALLYSLLQLVSAIPASAMLEEKERDRITMDFFCHDSMVSIYGQSGLAAAPRYHGRDRTDPVPLDVLNHSTHTSVFYRLKAGIVMVPRMNRTPKPKSVHRGYARAPGERHSFFEMPFCRLYNFSR